MDDTEKPAPAPHKLRPAAKRERPEGLPRDRRVRRSNDFQRIERQGQRAHGSFVTVVARVARGPGRVGFTVSKKVGNAVQRNHVKRRLREAARKNKDAWRGRDVVIIAKPEAQGRELHELESDFLATLKKLDEKRGPHGKQAR